MGEDGDAFPDGGQVTVLLSGGLEWSDGGVNPRPFVVTGGSVVLPEFTATQAGNGTVTVTGSGVLAGQVALVPVNDLRAWRQDLLAGVNNARAGESLPPMNLSSALSDAAQNWAEHMAATGDFSHNLDMATEIPPGWTLYGQNILYHFLDSATVHLSVWLDSPPNRAHIMSTNDNVGLGRAVAGNGLWYAVQYFGRYGTALASPPLTGC